MWTCIAVSLLCMGFAGCVEKAATPALMEHTAADFSEKLHSGKTMFIYFQQQVTDTVSLFLMELEESADALKYYGVLVGKVDCSVEPVLGYCTGEKALNTAFLFRGGKEFLGFNLDTVFSVNSIVSEVLFAILREEIKYIHTESDLLALENAARGKKDVVLGYVSSLGSQEHRSMMETAYVYGSKYQFGLITGSPVLNHLGLDEKSPSSQVWFLHCGGAHGGAKTSEHCASTRMSKPLTTLGIHSFLQLMEAPLVSEVYDDPSSVQSPQFPYQDTAQVFLFSSPASRQEDLLAATALAWRLRGLALLMLVHRQSPAVKTPDQYTAAYRLSKKGSEVQYLNSNCPDELLALIKEGEEEEEKPLSTNTIPNTEFHDLDDEIAVSTFENRLNSPDADSLTQLTSDNFHAAVARSGLTVALFHLPWEAVSKTFLGSYIEVAGRLEGSEVQMTAVNCAVWTDLCAAESGAAPPIPFQPLTVFPTVLLLRPGESAQRYGGMLGAEALHRFIALSLPASPALLSIQEEVTSFLQEVPHLGPAGHTPHRVLGLFEAGAGVRAFAEAAKSLRGEVLTALLTGGLAEKWAVQHNVALPAVLAFPSWGSPARPSSALPASSSSEELLAHISTALLHPLPELTVENLPSFLSLGKGLLLLFVGEEEDEVASRRNQALLEEMRGLVELGGRRVEPYLVCWIHLGRTPAGRSVLGSFLGATPALPALVLTHLPTGGEVYQYPPGRPIVASSVLQWVQSVEDGANAAAGMLGGDSWPPASELLDFLKIMDMQGPNIRQQAAPKPAEQSGEALGKAAAPPASTQHPHTEL